MKRFFLTIAIMVAAVCTAQNSYSQGTNNRKVVIIKEKDGGKESSKRSYSSYDESSANMITRNFEFRGDGIRGIKAGGVFDIQVVKGRSGKVSVTAPEKTMEHIIVSNTNGIIVLKIENGYNVVNGRSRSVGWLKQRTLKGPIKVKIESSSLSKIELSGAAKLVARENYSEDECKIELSGASQALIDEVRAREIDLDLSGASNVKIKTDCDKLDIEMSGASKLNLECNASIMDSEFGGASNALIKGEVENVKIEASGASKCSADNLKIKHLKIDISGASSVNTFVKKSVTGEVSGASSFTYSGDPDRVIIDKSRGSSVKQRQ